MSEFSNYVIEPNNGFRHQDEGIVGFYALPVLADLQNTGDRVQTMVNELGIPFVMSDLFAQKKRTVFGYEARSANAVTGDIYRDMSLRRLDSSRQALENLGARTYLAMGDSLGVAAVQGMQLHAPSDQRFDAVLLRDGWNLQKPARNGRGLARYIGYQVRNALHDVVSRNDLQIEDHGYGQVPREEVDETSLREKLTNVADTMRGPENRQGALELAKRAAQTGHGVLHVVGYRQGLSGSEQSLKSFAIDLQTAHNNAKREQDVTSRMTTRLRVDISDGYHSDLMNPLRGAHDVRNTLELL